MNAVIQSFLGALGFWGSTNLILFQDYQKHISSKSMMAAIEEIKPEAIYLVDEKPFIAFIYDYGQHFLSISKATWNAEIPILIVCDSNTVKIYNGRDMNMTTFLLSEVEKGNLSDFTIDSDFSMPSISDPSFWHKRKKDYSRTQLQDSLYENLKFLSSTLKDTYQVSFGTKLVLRMIFIRYLVDRGIDIQWEGLSGVTKESQEELCHIFRDKTRLYHLFQHIKDEFNGSLFQVDGEFDLLPEDACILMADFLQGDIMLTSGQTSLFTLYDFKIISIEMISNIYEILLGDEAKQSTKSFYTPNYLAEYMVDKATSMLPSQNSDFTLLDPACGSGIFLVNGYKAMLENRLLAKGVLSDEDLIQILSTKIYGVDVNEEAIDVAIFSLYLMLLSYKDSNDFSCFKFPNLKEKTLIVADFFDDNKLTCLAGCSFDLILGNPPWGSIKEGKHLEYCKRTGNIDKQQNSEICRSFVFRVKDFCTPDTICSLILHSKILYTQKSPSKLFRKYLLSETKLLDVVEMSSVRKLVFKHASAPAVVMTFQNHAPEPEHKMVYTSLKPNLFFELFHIIIIEKHDVKYVPQPLLLANDWAWKTIVYGFSRDIDIILRLKDEFSLLKDAISKNGLKKDTGIQIKGNEAHDSSHLIGQNYLESKKGLSSFFVDMTNARIIHEKTMRRPKKSTDTLFTPPYLLIKKGVDPSTFRFRSAVTEEKIVYSDAVTGIYGNPLELEFLFLLSGVCNSSFFAYLNLMLGSSIGIEREQGFSEEMMQYPIIYSKTIATLAMEIHELARNGEYNSRELQKLDEIVLKEFNLTDNKFVDYALHVQIPMLTGRHTSYKQVTSENLHHYASFFVDHFKEVYGKHGYGINVSIYPKVSRRFSAFELELVKNTDLVKVEERATAKGNMELFQRIIHHDFNEMFYQTRDVIHFGESSFFILKPNLYRYWHPAIAQLDLSDVITEILSGGN